MASTSLGTMAEKIFLFVRASYKMVNFTKRITLSFCHIIKYKSLLSLKIDDFLLINRLLLLLSNIDN